MFNPELSAQEIADYQADMAAMEEELLEEWRQALEKQVRETELEAVLSLVGTDGKPLYERGGPAGARVALV